MRYELTRGNDSVWNDPPWQVEKVMDAGDRYLVASFKNRMDAALCMDSLEKSLESEKGVIIDA